MRLAHPTSFGEARSKHLPPRRGVEGGVVAWRRRWKLRGCPSESERDGGRFAWLMRGERRVGLGWAGDGPHLSIVQYIRSGVLLLF